MREERGDCVGCVGTVLHPGWGEEALQCVTWQLKRQWSFTALRANARVRIECAHHVTYHQAGGGSGVAPRSVGRTHSGWLSRQRSM